MKPWSRRPREIRTLFNPAFCGLVIARSIEGFHKTSNLSMPFSLSLLVLPLCLHKRTRDLLIKNSRRYFSRIAQEHPEMRVELAKRARGLMPYSMEGFAYLMACEAISVDDSGGVLLRAKSVMQTIKGTKDTRDCQKAALTLGRKFGQANDRVTIYTTLGIRP